ncbi:MAG: phosphatase PAP2 family protein [Clostridia bacterium]|nr:phosphatase PAP2 family protein [Clostridia bacterium]
MLTGNTFAFDWEVSLMEWLQTNLGDGFISVISFFSAFGEELLLVLILGVLFWGYDKKIGRTVGLNALMGLVWSPMIKNVFLRRRPYFDHEGIKILRVVDKSADANDIAAQGFSFPSGHSTNAVTVYASIAGQIKKRWLACLAVVLPLLVGFSRVVIGAHYPTDVLAGWALGLLCICVVSLLWKAIKNELALYGVLLLTALPGLFYCKSADYFTSLGLMLGFMTGDQLEQRKVRFENTHNLLRCLLRALGGAAIFFALNTLLKLPFPKDFLDSASFAALMVRCLRYAVTAFALFGVYPIAFKYTDRLWNHARGEKA